MFHSGSGYPYAVSFSATNDLKEIRNLVNQELLNFVAVENKYLNEIASELAPVATAMERFLLDSGKRLRPLFAYIGFLGTGSKPSVEILRACAALELVHVCALMHDDVMDASDTRRGEPAIHKLFGNSILAGSLSDFKNSEVTEVGRKIWQGFAKLHSEWMSLYRKESFAMINFAVHEWLLDNLQAPNSDHFLAMAASLFDPKGKSLKTHLANLKLAEQKMQQSEKEKDDSQKVAWLMTAHGSKGLEFDRVWIVGLQNGAFPSEKSSLEEERRLMFVAMTRAREALWISASAEKQPSIFIQEAGLQKSNVVSPYGE